MQTSQRAITDSSTKSKQVEINMSLGQDFKRRQIGTRRVGSIALRAEGRRD